MAPRCLSNLRCASRGLELALRQSWFISTPMPFRVDLTKSRMTIWDAGDETLMELHVSHPKHPVPPRSVADVARITTNGCTDLIALIKEVSTQTRKNKSDDDIVDVELLVNSMSGSVTLGIPQRCALVPAGSSQEGVVPAVYWYG